ncbi:hypothetical protein DUI87_14906 [Hirundo rustica rustica]|uniref:Uncharacterized protein n=1 Tax=Hirundo rustica rustica TaxID=333673 RepID=A0A3M0K697_HIRRU|nr:hypothetical protein DUI87_14906 [Hirundo rustica rustica]
MLPPVKTGDIFALILVLFLALLVASKEVELQVRGNLIVLSHLLPLRGCSLRSPSRLNSPCNPEIVGIETKGEVSPYGQELEKGHCWHQKENRKNKIKSGYQNKLTMNKFELKTGKKGNVDL